MLNNSSSKKELASFQSHDVDGSGLAPSSPSRFGTRSPWTNISTTCEASEDELREPSGASTPTGPADSNRGLSPSVASPIVPITNQVPISSVVQVVVVTFVVVSIPGDLSPISAAVGPVKWDVVNSSAGAVASAASNAIYGTRDSGSRDCSSTVATGAGPDDTDYDADSGCFLCSSSSFP